MGSTFLYLMCGGVCGSLRRVPDEPVPDDAVRLRAVNARLRELLAEREAEIAELRGQVAELGRCGRRLLSCGSGLPGWSRGSRTRRPGWGRTHGCASRHFTASMAFAPISRGSALPCPPRRTAEQRRRRLRFMLRTASSLPLAGLLTLGSDPARFQTKPPASYRASWQLPGPDSHRQATTSLRTRRTP